MMLNLWRMRSTGALCDAEIEVGPSRVSVLCHKNVLVAASDFFQKMFEHEFIENNADISTVGIDKDGSYNLTKEVVEAVLRYIYVGNLPNRVNTLIPDIFVLAHMWLLYGRYCNYCCIN